MSLNFIAQIKKKVIIILIVIFSLSETGCLGRAKVFNSPTLTIQMDARSTQPGSPTKNILPTNDGLTLLTTPTIPFGEIPEMKPTNNDIPNCNTVEKIYPDSEEGHKIGQELIKIHPDLSKVEDLQFLEIRSIDRLEGFVLFQAAFEHYFEPAIFVLKAIPDGYQYLSSWGGQAENASEIRDALANEVPKAPKVLFDCLQPAEWFLP
jgi:hypothetical protein